MPRRIPHNLSSNSQREAQAGSKRRNRRDSAADHQEVKGRAGHSRDVRPAQVSRACDRLQQPAPGRPWRPAFSRRRHEGRSQGIHVTQGQGECVWGGSRLHAGGWVRMQPDERVHATAGEGVGEPSMLVIDNRLMTDGIAMHRFTWTTLLGGVS